MSEPNRKSPRRRVAAEDRRRQIVAGALTCLAERAPEEWTLRQVARETGVAPSLITYFFDSWGGLLLSAYRALAERYEAEVAETEALHGRARLAAVIELYVGEHAEHRRLAGAHVALWAFSQREPALRREMARFSEASRAAVAQALAAHARAEGVVRDLTAASRTLYILLDGLWYERAVNPDYLDAAEAREMAWAYVDRALEG